MTVCRHLSDRIPEIAHGRSGWTAAESAHLDRCADCQAELELVRAAVRLAQRAPAVLHTESVTRGVLTRVAADRRIRRRARWAWALGAAAAAGIVVSLWGGSERVPPSPRQVADATAEIVLPELEPLDTAELDSLLRTMDAQPLGWSALDEPSLGDLEADELEQVLGTWEG